MSRICPPPEEPTTTYWRDLRGWKIVAVMVGLIIMQKPALGQNGKGQPDQNEVEDLNREKQEFMKTFKKEQQKLAREKDRDTVFLDTRPSRIPGNLLRFDQSGHVSALGISDPCMDTGKAFNMAKYRALAMTALAQKCTVQYVADFYTNEVNARDYETQKGRWEEYGKINASVEWDSDQVEVIDSHYTRFEEGMMKIKLKQPNLQSNESLQNSMKVKAHVYHVRDKVNGDWSNQWKYDIKFRVKGKHDFSSTYTLLHTRQVREIRTQWKGRKDSVCTAYFQYETQANAGNDTLTKKHPGYSLKKGLWAAYLQGILNKLLMTTHEEAEKVKAVDQSYNQNFEDLSRSIEKQVIKLKVSYLIIKENDLYFKKK